MNYPRPWRQAMGERTAILPIVASLPTVARSRAMERGRMIEMLGAFVLGGGVVAVGYELARGPDGEHAEASAVGDVAVAEAHAAPRSGGAPRRTTGGPKTAVQPRDGTPSASPDASGDEGPPKPPWLIPDEEGHYTAFPPIYGEPIPMDAEAEAEYPQHGIVTSLAAIVRAKPDLDGPIRGLLRGGTRVRVDGERVFGGHCGEGWNKVFPHGYICRIAGLRVGDEPPAVGVSFPEPNIDEPLPYEYWRVNDEMTPFFHRLPSFTEQDLADAAGQAWYAEHQRDPMPTHPDERPEDVPAVVKEYMNAGYYVTKAGEEIKSQRRFLRTTRGAYARKYQLSPKEGPEFKGHVLAGADDLPLYFIRRELAFMKREGELSDVLIKTEEVPERLSTHPFTKHIHMGPKAYYEDGEGRLMRAYAVSKAYKLKRPPGVAADEHWVHIDLSEQTLVAYEGDEPVFATLVSTGKDEGMTPVGVHRVQIKHIATSMRDQPQEDEAYSIDDVPWTQYFSGSVAVHGAFWHGGFGLVRSHGCVNMSPADARWLFGFTEPKLPPKWHAIAPEGREGSPIVVTE